MNTLNIYLNFPGTTEEAFEFYRSIFGGEFSAIQRFSETPEGAKLSDAEKKKLMHVSYPIGKGSILMGTDALESMGHKVSVGTNFHITVNAASKKEADNFHAKLAAGGKVTMPMADMFWGAYFGMLTDKYGIQWMISHDPKQA